MSNRQAEPPSSAEQALDGFRLNLDLGTVLRILDDFEAVLGSMLDLCMELIPSDAGSILLVSDDGNELYFKEAAGPKGKEVIRFRLKAGEGVAGWVAQNLEPVNITDVKADPRHTVRIGQAVGYEARSILCVPLRSGDETLGALELINHKPSGPFTDENLDTLTALAERISLIVERARIQRKKDDSYQALLDTERTLSRKIEELGVLYEIERKVNSSLPLDRILDILTEITVAALHAEAGSIYVVRDDGKALCFQAARGTKAADVVKIELKPGEGFAGWVVKHREPLVVNDVASDPRHRKDIAEKIGFPLHSMICVPLLRGERCIGAFQIMNKVRMDFAFTNDDLLLLQLIASQAAKLIENHWMEQERSTQANLVSLGRFVSSILHDIRSPLSTISGFAEILGQNTELDEPTRQRYLDYVQRDVEAIRSMADEILEFSMGEQRVHRQEVDVREFMEGFRDLLSRRLKGREIDVRFELPDDLGQMSVDPRKIERAFLNLAHNAADALEGKGSITISGRRQDNDLQFSFSDNGPGIPDHVRETLFEPFVTDKKAHAGLGLSIVKQIVEGHQGAISMESGAGEGTEFVIRLPRS